MEAASLGPVLFDALALELDGELKQARDFNLSLRHLGGGLLTEYFERRIACIVLPTYNEAENLHKLLPLIFGESENIPTHDLHVLVVDDNSPDGTGDYVRLAMLRYPRLHLISGEKKGLGEAYKRGITYAISALAPDLILQMDADLQHDPALLPHFIRLCEQGCDLVIGSRFAQKSDLAGLPWHRKLISLAGTKLVQWFGKIPAVTDCTSGYRCIRVGIIPSFEAVPHSTRGYSFQSWFLCELLRQSARYAEIPLSFPARAYGHSKLTFRDKLEFLACLSQLSRSERAPRRRVAAVPNRGASLPKTLPMEIRAQSNK